MSKKEANIRQEDVWDEHLKNVRQRAHWAYLFGVLVGSFILMVALIAVLGAG
jgi:hypothetical protein